MFGKKNKEIARLTNELAVARVSLEQMHAEYEKKLSDAKADINAREATITSQKVEIGKLNKSLNDGEEEKKRMSSARDVLASEYQNEGCKRTTAESALAAARRGEDPETDAFYAAKFASAKTEPESEAVEDAAAPELVAQTPEEPKEAPRQVARNTKRKR